MASSRVIHDVFSSLADDERFNGAGLALGRGVVDNAMVYEIRITEFEFDAASLAALEEVSAQEGLALAVDGGTATLRQLPVSPG